MGLCQGEKLSSFVKFDSAGLLCVDVLAGSERLPGNVIVGSDTRQIDNNFHLRIGEQGIVARIDAETIVS